MLADMGKRALGAFAATVGVLVACGLALGFLEGRATGYLYSVLGWGGIVVTGLVGTPIHELGHLVMCWMFGFQVNEVALFRPIAGRADGVLGFVNYSYDPTSLWQRLGCFFVGVAPMILGVAVLLLLLRLLTPEVWASLRDRLGRALDQGKGPLGLAGAAFSGFFGGLSRLRGWGLARGALCLYLLFSISTHMTLSLADLQGAAVGLLVVAVLCTLFGVVTGLMKKDVVPALKRTAATLTLFFGVGIAFAGMALAVFALLALVF